MDWRLPYETHLKKYDRKTEALFRAIRESIMGGTIAPGSRLPSTRALAAQYGLFRGMVSTVCEMLQAQGYVLAFPSIGTMAAHKGGNLQAAAREAAEEKLSDRGERIRVLPPAHPSGNPGGGTEDGRSPNRAEDGARRLVGHRAVFMLADISWNIRPEGHAGMAGGVPMKRLPDGYWSLYLDFVDAMGQLRIRGIPLALIGNFSKYVSEALRRRMDSGEGGRRPVNGASSAGQMILPGSRGIQPAFDARIKTLLLPTGSRTRGSHVAICTSLLRFPESVYFEYFRPEKAVIVADYASSGGRGMRHGLIVHNLQEYAGDCSRLTSYAIGLAEKLFSRASRHPLLADETLRERFLADIPEMVRLVVRTENYLEKHPPGCLLVGTTELMITRVLALAARRRAIPVICLQHGVIALEESYMPVFADIQGVYGPADVEWYAARGVSRRRLALTGHPRFDPIFTAAPLPECVLTAKIGIPPDEWRVLVATQPHLPTERISRLVQLLARQRGMRVLLKPHPLEERSEKMVAYERMAGAHRNITLLSGRVGLYDVLRHADCVIAESSTVGIEALLAGCPLFVLKGPYSALFERRGVPAGDPEQLAVWTAALSKRNVSLAGLADQALRSLYPLRLSAPTLAGLIRRTSGIDCRPRTSWLRDGMLLKGEGPAIYLIRGGMRRRIAGPKQLKALMRKYGEKVRLVSQDVLKRIPQGEPL